jgi:hypothetical protein
VRSNHPDSEAPSYDTAISACFELLIAVSCVTLIAAVALYGEPFSWDYAFSDLGSTATWQGKENVPSRLVFTLGGLSASVIMLRIWISNTGERRFRSQRAKRNLGALGTAGFLLSSVPNSQYHVVHTIGVILAFASLYLFTMFFYLELKAAMPPWRFLLELIALQVVVFSYAAAFFANWAAKQGFQKACIVGLFYTVVRAVSAGREGFGPRELFKSFHRFPR